jgi:hypothetical protein
MLNRNRGSARNNSAMPTSKEKTRTAFSFLINGRIKQAANGKNVKMDRIGIVV